MLPEDLMIFSEQSEFLTLSKGFSIHSTGYPNREIHAKIKEIKGFH